MKGFVGVTDKEAENRRNGEGETQKEGQSKKKLKADSSKLIEKRP
jgi:hypothetical protein